MTDENRLGQAITKYRMERGLSQGALAKAVGISRPYLTQIEGGTRIPSDETATRILHVLEVPLERFMRENVAGLVEDDQLDKVAMVLRGYDLLRKYLTDEQLAEVVEAFASAEQLAAAMEVLAVDAPPPGPEGWEKLGQTDRRLVQRIVNRLLASE